MVYEPATGTLIFGVLHYFNSHGAYVDEGILTVFHKDKATFVKYQKMIKDEMTKLASFGSFESVELQ